MSKHKQEPPQTAILLTVLEAATVLGVSRATIYRQIELGNLHAVKIGGRRLLTREEIQRFVNSLEVTQ